ncbi:glycosyltransferase family 4 protein [Bdellovibrio sp. SKB1291214]|uniref:glycosyltransferase family 4 protein n=1 Tax=Bdellovibrio sp. SKB1291214 TaxID=1732569 RepID=UPI000B514F6C|nr:glycosyltransferase family 4 protein [Bdellovibrio sp. SKB1291214]UYL07274.1 glycosyltransferase family 4 protein [Bdellovibrio sp. SKB1291214]
MPETILQVCLSTSWGGQEMVALETAQLLQQKNIKCTTVTVSGSPLMQRLVHSHCAVLECNSGTFRTLSSIIQIRRFLKTQKFSTILVQQLRDLFWIRLASLGYKQNKIIGISHTFLGVFKKDLYHRWIYGRVQEIIALTETHRANLIDHLAIESEKIVVIPNSVSTEKFSPRHKNALLRKEFGCDERTVLIGLIGRLDKAKGQGLLIKAAALLKNNISNFKIVLVGEETLNEQGNLGELKNLCSELNLQEEVIFTGFRTDIPQIAASLDILVMSSDAETFGRVIIEGMASEVAVIGSKAGGVVDIIDDGKTGLLFEPGNAAALANKLLVLSQNLGLRKELAHNGRLKVLNQYDQGKVNEQLLNQLIA